MEEEKLSFGAPYESFSAVMSISSLGAGIISPIPLQLGTSQDNMYLVDKLPKKNLLALF